MQYMTHLTGTGHHGIETLHIYWSSGAAQYFLVVLACLLFPVEIYTGTAFIHDYKMQSTINMICSEEGQTLD